MLGNETTVYVTVGARLRPTDCYFNSSDDASVDEFITYGFKGRYQRPFARTVNNSYCAVRFKSSIDANAEVFDLSGSENSESTVYGWISYDGEYPVLNICAADGGIVYAPYNSTGLFSGITSCPDLSSLELNRIIFYKRYDSF